MKKIISWIVPVLMLASCISFAPVYSAGESEAEQKAAEKLIMLGMTKSYIPKSTVSRGEFVSILAKVITADTTDYGDNIYFLDVPPEYKYADAVNKMAAHGAVLGDENKRFYPDDNITIEEASSLLVRFLGYHIRAEEKGGFPTGYLTEAMMLGLLKGVSVNSGNISRGDAFVMIANALETDLFVQTAVGEKVNYKAAKNKTLLSEYMQIYDTKGVLWAVGDFNLLPGQSVGKDEIIVGDEKIRTAEDEAWLWQDRTGTYVTAYYREDNDVLSLVGMVENESGSARKSLVLDIEDISDISGTTISYFEGGRTKKATFSKSSYIMYNNRTADVFEMNTLLGKNGTVTLIDPLGNGYSVVKIKVYDEYVVRSVALDSGIISDMYHVAAPLPELTDGECYCIRDEKGQKLSLSDIAPWNVLSVAVSLDGTYREIVVSTQSVMGTVDIIGNNGEITIAGRKYNLSKTYEKYTENALRLGQKVRVYFNIFGEIAAVDSQSSDDFQPGVLVNAEFETQVFSPVVKIRVFAADAEFYTYELKLRASDKFMCNGKLMDLAELNRLFRTPFNYDSAVTAELNTEITMAPIRYRLNDEGQVIELEYDDPNNGERDGLRKLNRGLTGNQTYKRTARSFGGLVNIASDAVVFVCPLDRNDENDFSVKTATYFANDTAYSLTTMAIMATEKDSFEGSIVMRQRQLSAVDASDNLAVVLESFDTLNEDGVIVQGLRVLEAGAENDVTVKEGLRFDCSHGDAIRYQTNGSGEAVLMERWAHNNAGTVEWDKRTTNFSYTQNSRIVYAIPEEIKNGVAKVTIYDTTTDEVMGTEYFLLSPFKYYLVDCAAREDNQVFAADSNAIRDRKSFPHNYSKLLIHTVKGDGKTIVIYNNGEDR